MMHVPAFMIRPAQPVAIYFLCLVCWAQAADFQGAGHALSYEGPPINYQTARPQDAVTKLQERIRSGELELCFDQQLGYLPSLLNALTVPPSSQMLVFSKTSLQRRNSSPGNPRAIFFNGDVYIGFIPGAPAIEISTADPKLGAVFYRLENKKFERPEFSREMDCL